MTPKHCHKTIAHFKDPCTTKNPHLGKIHVFDVGHATKYGIEKALIIDFLLEAIGSKHKFGTHLVEERRWLPLSSSVLDEYFPYIKPATIKRCLEELQEQGVLLKKDLKNTTRCRNACYAFADDSLFPLANGGSQ